MTRLWLVGFALYTALAVCVRRLVRGARHPEWGLRFEVVVVLLRRILMRAGRLAEGAPPPSRGEARSRAEASGRAPRGRRGVAIERRTLAGRRAEVQTPPGWSPGGATLYYLHGGGYVAGSPATHRGLLGRIVVASGVRCVALDYRKAPAHPFPAAVDDAVAGYLELLQEGVGHERLFIGGDSAGGGLSLATLLSLRDAGHPLPRAAVLLSPWADLAEDPADVEDLGLDYLVPPMAVVGARLYLQGAASTAPLASPVHADLSGLPPMLVQSGGVEMLLGQNRRLVERARAAGVAIEHDVAEGMVHVYQAFAPLQPASADGIERLARYLVAAAQVPARRASEVQGGAHV